MGGTQPVALCMASGMFRAILRKDYRAKRSAWRSPPWRRRLVRRIPLTAVAASPCWPMGRREARPNMGTRWSRTFGVPVDRLPTSPLGPGEARCARSAAKAVVSFTLRRATDDNALQLQRTWGTDRSGSPGSKGLLARRGRRPAPRTADRPGPLVERYAAADEPGDRPDGFCVTHSYRVHCAIVFIPPRFHSLLFSPQGRVRGTQRRTALA